MRSLRKDRDPEGERTDRLPIEIKTLIYAQYFLSSNNGEWKHLVSLKRKKYHRKLGIIKENNIKASLFN